MDDGLAAVMAQVADARARARVNRHFGRAAQMYRTALRRLDALGDGVPRAEASAVRARALVGLAACSTELGAGQESVLDVLDEAARWARDANDDALVATVRGNRGLQLLRTGDLRSAKHELDAALEHMSDEEEMVPALLNRGSLHLERGDVEAAARDFERCRDLARGDAEVVFRPMAEHNLGYAYYLRGDLPAALRAMDSAASAAPPEHAGVGLVDKATVLLEAGLLTDAEAALTEASQLLAASHGSRDLLDAQITRARCLVALDRNEEAARLAQRAGARARRAGLVLVELRAELIVLDAKHGRHQEGSGRSRELERLAQAATGLRERAESTAGAERVAVDASLVAAEAFARAGRATEAQGELQRVPSSRDLPLGARVRREVVQALVAFGGGDRRAGLRAVRRGHSLLATQRQRLGAVEAVTAAAAHGIRLQHVDVDAALATGRAASVFDALERGRATFAGAGRVHPPDDEETAALVAGARRLFDRARQLRATPGAADEQSRLHREARRLQNRARERSWYVSGNAEVPQPATARGMQADLSAAGDDRVILNFTLRRGRVLVLRVDQEGSRLVDLLAVDELREHAHRMRADLRIVANSLIPAPLRGTALRSLTRELTWVDDVLLQKLDVTGPVFVAARDRLVSLPWAALPSRRGLSTVVNSWVDRGTGSWRPGRGVAVAGPDLSGAPTEARAVADVWRGTTRCLTGEDARCEAVADAIGGAAVVHIAAHGTHEPENPMFSRLALADGPLFAHELDGQDLSQSVVVLSACDVGSMSMRHGGEPLGLTSVLLRMGARAVVAAVAPLRDDVAVRVMPALHRELKAGTRPGVALANAIVDEPEPVPLVCFGRSGEW